MVLSVVRIGNSKGIRLPKALLEQCHITDKVEVEISGEEITLKPLNKTRENWEQQMKLMHERKEDTLLISDSIDSDFEEWEW